MCAACANGFSHSGLGDKCNLCPAPAANNAIAVAGVFAGIAGLFVYVFITLSDEGKIDPADGAKTIGLSYVQIISMLATFPVDWPDIFVSIFQIGGAVGKLVCGAVVLLGMYFYVYIFAHLSIFFYHFLHSCHGTTFCQFKMHVPRTIRSRCLLFHPNHLGHITPCNTLLCDIDLVGHFSGQRSRAVPFENESNGGSAVVFDVARFVQ